MNPKRGVVFWWSAKCGCTTVKSIMLESMAYDFARDKVVADEASIRSSMDRLLYSKKGSSGSELDGVVSEFLRDNCISSIHCMIAGPLLRLSLEEASKLVNVLFLRDPFQRFVSGVVDKHVEGYFSSVYKPLNFFDATRNIGLMEPHHFAPQSSEAFLPRLKYDRVFDISSIDFGYLSGLLGMEVVPRFLHKKRNYSMPCDPSLPRAGYEVLASLKASGDMPAYECFYDEESRENVASYYRGDLELMKLLSPDGAS